MLKETVVLLALACVAFAAVGIAKLEEKPKKYEGVEGCYISKLDAVIPVGKSAPSKTACMEYRCGKTTVKLVSCGVVDAAPPCYVVRDETKPYPGCCPTIQCDNRHYLFILIMLKETVVLLSLACVAFAAVGIAKLEEKPKKFEGFEGCYISELDAVIPFGKSAPSKTTCMEYRCGKTMVTLVSCGAVAAAPPCYVVSDETKLYPDCCPTIQCDNRH